MRKSIFPDEIAFACSSIKLCLIISFLIWESAKCVFLRLASQYFCDLTLSFFCQGYGSRWGLSVENPVSQILVWACGLAVSLQQNHQIWEQKGTDPTWEYRPFQAWRANLFPWRLPDSVRALLVQVCGWQGSFGVVERVIKTVTWIGFAEYLNPSP